MLKVYGIKNCDSVRKALKYFKTHDIPYEFIDFKQTPVLRNKIDEWLQQTDITTLFNTKGTTYRTLKLKDIGLNEKEKADWLVKENMLIKRPIIEYNGKVIVGYNEAYYRENLS
ncbi:MAG: Spx/MgsR family RNA polymerase-binding regulatory protein [Campylobacterales bacterium]|nr:Spx/MgsR family RNA polymerase-binding regulatory protein [Campylobacterales bacterium]